MTDAEKKLWSRIRSNQQGIHFRRQVPFGPYIVDFLAIKAKLVLEVDGSQHHTPEGRKSDAKRDAYLREKGLRVLRYSDIEILKNVDGVLQDIYDHIQNNPNFLSFRRGSG